MAEKPPPKACRPAGREWFTLPLLIAIEVYLKLNAYAKNLPSGQILSLDYGGYEAGVSWGYHENPGSAMWIIVGNKWNTHMSNIFSKVAYFIAMSGAAGLMRYVFKNPVTVNLRCGTLFLVAGALGNLMDRLSIGAVVDYWYLRVILPIIPHISLYFNLSDLYIDVAFASLVIAMIRDDFDFENTGGGPGSRLERYFANGVVQAAHPVEKRTSPQESGKTYFHNGKDITGPGKVADEISTSATESKKMR
jgi:lipoprotein signal peptidase